MWTDLSLGEVSDADLAHEGDEVVLAEGEHLDVLHDHKLVRLLVEHGGLDGLLYGVLITWSLKKNLLF